MAKQIYGCQSVQLAVALTLLFGNMAQAREYFIGGPVHQHDMENVAN